MSTFFDLRERLTSWFFRRDRDIHTGGNDINTGGGDVIVGAGTVDGVDLTAHVADGDAHHNESHSLTSHSGQLSHDSDLTDVSANDHHDEAHTLASHSGQLSHDSDLTDISANDHHDEAHNVASHSDTSATGSELNTLTDGSDASSLHDHDGRYFQESEFSSSTGTTSKPLKTDSGGELTVDRITAEDALAVSGTGLLILVERISPGTASTGTIRIYAKSDGKLYFKNDGGTEFEVATV